MTCENSPTKEHLYVHKGRTAYDITRPYEVYMFMYCKYCPEHITVPVHHKPQVDFTDNLDFIMRTK